MEAVNADSFDFINAYEGQGRTLKLTEYLQLVSTGEKELGEFSRTPQWEAMRAKARAVDIIIVPKRRAAISTMSRGLINLQHKYRSLLATKIDQEKFTYEPSTTIIRSVAIRDTETLLPEEFEVEALDFISTVVPATKEKHLTYIPTYQTFKPDQEVLTIAAGITRTSFTLIGTREEMPGTLHMELANTVKNHFFGASSEQGQLGRLEKVLEVSATNNILLSLIPHYWRDPKEKTVLPLWEPAWKRSEIADYWGEGAIDRITQTALFVFDNTIASIALGGPDDRVNSLHPFFFTSKHILLLDQVFSTEPVYRSAFKQYLRALHDESTPDTPNPILHSTLKAIFPNLREEKISYEDEEDALNAFVTKKVYLPYMKDFWTGLIRFKPTSSSGLMIVGKHRDNLGLELNTASGVIGFFQSWVDGRVPLQLDFARVVEALSLARMIPKQEVFAKSKLMVKERNIMSTNTFFYLPLNMFLRAYFSAFHAFHGEVHERPHPEITLLYPFTPARGFLSSLIKYFYSLPIPSVKFPYSKWHAFIYSDNLYLARRWIDTAALREYMVANDIVGTLENDDFKIMDDILTAKRERLGLRAAKGVVFDGFGYVEYASMDGSSMEGSTDLVSITAFAISVLNQMFPNCLSGQDQVRILSAAIQRKSPFTDEERERFEANEKKKKFKTRYETGNPRISSGWIAYIITAMQMSVSGTYLWGSSMFSCDHLMSGTAPTFFANTMRLMIHANQLLEYLAYINTVDPSYIADPTVAPCILYKHPTQERQEEMFGFRIWEDLYYKNKDLLYSGVFEQRGSYVFDRHKFYAEGKMEHKIRVGDSEKLVYLFPQTPPLSPFAPRMDRAMSYFNKIRGVHLTKELYVTPNNFPGYTGFMAPLATAVRPMDLLGFDAYSFYLGDERVMFTIPVLARSRLLKMLLWTKTGAIKKLSLGEVQPGHFMESIYLKVAKLAKYRTAYMLGGWVDPEMRILISTLVKNYSTIMAEDMKDPVFMQTYAETVTALLQDELLTDGNLSIVESLHPHMVRDLVSKPVPSYLDIFSVFLSRDDFKSAASLMSETLVNAYQQSGDDDYEVLHRNYLGDDEDLMKWTSVELTEDNPLLVGARNRNMALSILKPQDLSVRGPMGMFYVPTEESRLRTYAESSSDEEFAQFKPRLEKVYHDLTIGKKSVDWSIPLNLYPDLLEADWQMRNLPRPLMFSVFRLILARAAGVPLRVVRRFTHIEDKDFSRAFPKNAANVFVRFVDPQADEKDPGRILGSNESVIGDTAELYLDAPTYKETNPAAPMRSRARTKKGGKQVRFNQHRDREFEAETYGERKAMEKGVTEEELEERRELRQAKLDQMEMDMEKSGSANARRALETFRRKHGRQGGYDDDD